MGGHDVARDLWTDYFVACNAVIYLLDCNDRERFVESKAELDKLLSTEAKRAYGNEINFASFTYGASNM